MIIGTSLFVFPLTALHLAHRLRGAGRWWAYPPSPSAIHLSPGTGAWRVKMAGAPSAAARRIRGIGPVLSREWRGLM